MRAIHWSLANFLPKWWYYMHCFPFCCQQEQAVGRTVYLLIIGDPILFCDVIVAVHLIKRLFSDIVRWLNSHWVQSIISVNTLVCTGKTYFTSRGGCKTGLKEAMRHFGPLTEPLTPSHICWHIPANITIGHRYPKYITFSVKSS